MFVAALFTVAKIWKQPKCPLTDEWIKKIWYIDTVEYYLAIKKNEGVLLWHSRLRIAAVVCVSSRGPGNFHMLWAQPKKRKKRENEIMPFVALLDRPRDNHTK